MSVQEVADGRGGQQPQGGPKVDAPPKDAPVLWDDVEARLLGFLSGRAFAAVRTPATPQSLNLQGLNWLGKSEDFLPAKCRHPAWQANAVAAAVNAILPPTAPEEALMRVYQERGADIKELNAALADMDDRRVDMRWFLGAAGAVAVGTGVVLAASRATSSSDVIPGLLSTGWKEVAACGLVGVGVAGVATYGLSRVRDLFKTVRAQRWY